MKIIFDEEFDSLLHKKLPFKLHLSADELIEMHKNNNELSVKANQEDAEIIEDKTENTAFPDSLIETAKIMNEIISFNRIEPETDDFYVDLSTRQKACDFFKKIINSDKMSKVFSFLAKNNNNVFTSHMKNFNNIVAEINSFYSDYICKNDKIFSADNTVSFLNGTVLENILQNINTPIANRYARKGDFYEQCRELLILIHDFLAVIGYYTPPLFVEILQNYDDIPENLNIASFYNVDSIPEDDKTLIGTIKNISPLPYCMRFMDSKEEIRTYVRKGQIMILSGGS